MMGNPRTVSNDQTQSSAFTSSFCLVENLEQRTLFATLSIIAPPVGTSAGATLSAIKVAVLNLDGGVDTSADEFIGVSLATDGSSTGPGTLSGTSLEATFKGVSTFSNLSISQPGQYVLFFEEQSGGHIDSAPFQIGSGGGGGGGGAGGTLTATLLAKTPSTLISGEKVKASFATSVVNAGSSAISESVSSTLYLSTNGLVDANAINVETLPSKKLNLKVGAKAPINGKLATLPATIPAGSYQWIVRVTDPNGVTTDAVAPGTVTVAAPEIDLSGAFAKFTTTAKAGKKFTETITLSNTAGNVFATETLPILVQTSADGTTTNAATLTTIDKKIKIAPGKFSRITLKLTAPATPGPDFIVITLLPLNSLVDSNESNNTFASPTAFVVT